MKKRLVLALAAATVVAASCGPVLVTVRRLERANLSIPPASRLAVTDFQDPAARGMGPAIGNVLVSHLASQGFYQMVERDRIQAVMKEHALNLTGAIDPATVRELGGLLGVDAIVTGEVLAYGVETTRRTEMVEKKEGTGRYEEVEKKNIFTGKKYKTKQEIMRTALVPEERTVKSGGVSVSYRMIDIASGQVVVSKTNSESYNKSFKENIPSDSEILSKLLDKVTGAFVSDISPHYVTVAKRLLSSKADPKNMGAAYARQGEWQRAVEIWQRGTVTAPGDAALWHNIGVGFEAQGRIEQAESTYNRALAIDPGNRVFIEDIAQIRNAFRGSLPSGAQTMATAETATGTAKTFDSTPKIVKIEPTGEVYISIGSKAGVKPGDKMVVCGEKEIRNPDTGEVLGVDTFDKAELIVTKVMDNISLCKMSKALSNNKMAVKDKVKPMK
ncbi:MAG: DUF6340 family protein [Candidatus Edwardsbacteria bacterium]|jgi:hypothetical protein|nr:DUF6340 family protein [Candidatus Edwardsbacteria bacterium]